MSTLVNLACFQCTWLALVHGAARGRVFPGALALAASIALQSVPRVPVRLPRPALIAAATALGLVADSLLVLLGVLAFPAQHDAAWPVPLWMVLLWANFALTLDESLAWAGDRPLLAAALGAVAGPMAYRYGEAVGALELGSPVPSLLAIAALWMAAFPLLATATARLRDRRTPPRAAGAEGRT